MAELMERFYTHLRAKVPEAEALRAAQFKTLVEHPEPYYWAGSMLVGGCWIALRSHVDARVYTD